jgi:hypothetical protein
MALFTLLKRQKLRLIILSTNEDVGKQELLCDTADYLNLYFYLEENI